MGIDGKYKPLSIEENKQADHQSLSSLKKILVDFITRTTYRRSLDATISFNARTCAGKPFCNEAFYTTDSARFELQRQGMSLAEWATSNEFFQALSFISTLWCIYAIFTGCLSMILRMRAVCRRKSREMSCIRLIFALAY